MTKFVEVETVREWLGDSGEIAFLDVREEGQQDRVIRCSR